MLRQLVIRNLAVFHRVSLAIAHLGRTPAIPAMVCVAKGKSKLLARFLLASRFPRQSCSHLSSRQRVGQHYCEIGDIQIPLMVHS
jgi:hypothetical protein